MRPCLADPDDSLYLSGEPPSAAAQGEPAQNPPVDDGVYEEVNLEDMEFDDIEEVRAKVSTVQRGLMTRLCVHPCLCERGGEGGRGGGLAKCFLCLP